MIVIVTLRVLSSQKEKESPSSASFFRVDALSHERAALDEGDQLAVLDEALDDGVVGGVGGVLLRVNHLLAVEGDGGLDGPIVGRRLVELHALLEAHFRRLEGG